MRYLRLTAQPKFDTENIATGPYLGPAREAGPSVGKHMGVRASPRPETRARCVCSRARDQTHTSIPAAEGVLAHQPLAHNRRDSAKPPPAAKTALHDGSSEEWFVYVAERSQLPDRETEMMRPLCPGRTKRHIAEMLYLSEDTVRWHSKQLYRKLDAHSKQELVNLVGIG